MDLQYGDLRYSTCVMQATKTKDLKLKFFPHPWEKGGGLFSAQFSGMSVFFCLELYLGDQLCSKCTNKSFVSYSVNEIQACKDNILMTLQSSLASKVTVIAGILVVLWQGCLQTFHMHHNPESCSSVYVSILKS